MKINDLKPNSGAVKKSKRLGRGDSSGHGSTSTRGNKGHKARSGYSRPGDFEGGQMSLIRRLPKRGFTPLAKKPKETVNLDQLEGKFSPGSLITPTELQKTGLVRNGYPVKILGRGDLSKKFEVHAHFFSKKAKENIEKTGGQAVLLNQKSNIKNKK
jgi:large subunit ribosomal protein L15